MPDAIDLFALGNGAIVAPAGHGKTEIIAKLAALGLRALVLTHTHAGVNAIRGRMKRLGIPRSQVAVDTIAGWAMRYGHAFPGAASPPKGMPEGAEWDQLYIGALLALKVIAVRQVVAASYDRILIDEYQDCGALQNELALELSAIVPTLIFGDPMQGIFEFAGATLDWTDDIHPHFPLAGTLGTGHRWADKNEALGEWIAETRLKLQRGDPIDLTDPRIEYRASSDEFDMGTLFDGIDGKTGTFAAIHCSKALCYKIAAAANGGYQAIEEVAAKRLVQFATTWEQASAASDKLAAILALSKDCFKIKKPAEGDAIDQVELAIKDGMNEAARRLGEGNGAAAAVEIFKLARKRATWKLYRSELWRDAERALAELAEGRAENLADATDRIRQRVGNMGRSLSKRTISTPYLLKGLEFDHVVIPNATHFGREQYANAKLFYVAISRATRSLTISSSSPILQFERPR